MSKNRYPKPIGKPGDYTVLELTPTAYLDYMSQQIGHVSRTQTDDPIVQTFLDTARTALKGAITRWQETESEL